MAGSVTGLHVFAADVGPEPLSLLDGNFSPLATAINTLSSFSNYYVDSGAVNALAITVLAPQVCASYTDGLMVQVQVANTTTSATPTLNINGLGARTIVHNDLSALVAGELVAGQRILVIYDSTNAEFRLLSATYTGTVMTAPTFNATVTINAVAAKNSLVVNATGGGPTTFGPGGNVTIGVPSGGIAFTVSGVDNSGAVDIRLPNAGGANHGGYLRFFDTTNSLARGFIGIGQATMIGAAVTDFAIGPGSGGATNIVDPSGNAALTVGSGRNVTIAAPSSGVALTVNGLNGSHALAINSTGAASTFFVGWNDTIFGSAWNMLSQSTDPLAIGTTGNTTLTLSTNANNRVSISGAGNVTINAPSSGISLSITGPGGISGTTIQISGGTIYNNSQAVPALGMNSSGAFFGQIQNDAANTWSLSYNNTSVYTLGTPALQWNTTPQLLGRGPVAGALVDMTPDTGTFTLTLSGVTGGTGTATWIRSGNFVTLFLPAITGTSTSTTLNGTGMPAAIQPATLTQPFFAPYNALEDNTTLLTNNGSIVINAASGTITFNKGGANNWTNGGTKGIAIGFSVTYSLK